jgi:hypothetical protein
MYYTGLDLHKRYFTLCVLTREGQVVQDHRWLPADLEPLRTILRDLGGPVTVTVEATWQWAWLHGRLIEAVQTHKQVPGPVRFPYERLLRAKGKPKATVAAARKLCTYIYWMLREQRTYPEWLEQETKRAGCPMQRTAPSA